MSAPSDRPHLDLTRYAVLRSHLDVADEVLADMGDAVPVMVLTAMTTAQMFAREGFREAWDALDAKQAGASEQPTPCPGCDGGWGLADNAHTRDDRCQYGPPKASSSAGDERV